MTPIELEQDKKLFESEVLSKYPEAKFGYSVHRDLEGVFSYLESDLSRTIGFWCGRLTDNGDCALLQHSVYVPPVCSGKCGPYAGELAKAQMLSNSEDNSMTEESIKSTHDNWLQYILAAGLCERIKVIVAESEIQKTEIALTTDGDVCGVFCVAGVTGSRMIMYCNTFFPSVPVHQLGTPLNSIIEPLLKEAYQKNPEP